MDLRATVTDSVHLHATAAAAKGIALRCAIAEDVPRDVKGDPVRVRQTLVNLVGNAVKFTDEGGVSVDARVVRRSGNQIVLRVAVTDTGIGIPPERHAPVFESLAQAEEGTSRVYGGTGLGLTICRQLVELMGGRIGLTSRPGEGSCFWFELPMECPVPRDAAAA